MASTASSQPAFLGLDAGGSATRWALADAAGTLQREGAVAGLSGLQLHDAAGRAAVTQALRDVAAGAGPVHGIVAGVTGFDAAQAPLLSGLLATALGVAAGAVQAMSDIELSCRAAFAPGQGCVLVAGTGSIAACIDAQGTLHRAGGRGAVIDDAGGGHWIACQALRQVWRAEDAAPGAWQTSALARRLFGHIGGTDWAQTRQWVYGASRGELATLALAVAAAAAADEDAAALTILQRAGMELARLARVLLQRHGPQPLALALAGRVFELHPAIEAQLRLALAPGTPVHRLSEPAHVAAARLAAQGAAP